MTTEPARRRLGVVCLLAILSICLAARAVSAQIVLTGGWTYCGVCNPACEAGDQQYAGRLDVVQAQDFFQVNLFIGGSGVSYSGTIDQGTGAFTTSGPFGTVVGSGSLLGMTGHMHVTGVFNFPVDLDFTALRECPTPTFDCDDGNPATTDTCCNTPVGVCGNAVACTHDAAPVCFATTTSTTLPSTTSTHTTTSSSSSSTTTSTTLLDRPVTGVKLELRRTSSGRERVVFVSKDPAFLFPAIGTSDDPASGTPGGLRIELLSQQEGLAVLSVPAGLGNPGWVVQDAALDGYRFKNLAAPGGISVVRSITLKQGRQLKVSASATGLALVVPQGSVGIRITTGALRSCALFDGITSTVDVPGTFIAKKAVVGSLTSCSNASLGIP